MLLGFLTDGGAAAFGWFAYPPLSGAGGSPGLGADLWIIVDHPHRHVGHAHARST